MSQKPPRNRTATTCLTIATCGALAYFAMWIYMEGSLTMFQPVVVPIVDPLTSLLRAVEYDSDGAIIYHRATPVVNRTNAICISGNRADYMMVPDVYKSFRKHVFTQSNPDLFVYAYYDSQFNVTTFMDMYGDYLAGFMIKIWDDKEQRRIDREAPFTQGTRFASLFGNIHECHFSLLRPYAKYQRKAPYKVIMRARPDMQYYSPLNMSLFETDTFEKPTIYLPPPNNLDKGVVTRVPDDTETAFCMWPWGYKGVNDQCALGSPFIMDIYATLYAQLFQRKYLDMPEDVVTKFMVEDQHIYPKWAEFHYDLYRYNGQNVNPNENQTPAWKQTSEE